MSRSKKKPIIKDKGIGSKFYRRTIRRVQKHFLRVGRDIPNARQIINDYDRCDFIFNFTDTDNEVKFSRK